MKGARDGERVLELEVPGRGRGVKELQSEY